jgi:phosphomannomutase
MSEFKDSLPVHEIANEDINTEGKNWDEILKNIENNLADSNTRFDKLDGISIIRNDSWANIRPSTTEPLVRIYAGSHSHEKTLALISDIKKSF